jgi:hypothetical protein
MRRVALIVLLSIAARGADDKDKERFAPGSASSYAGHQTLDKITIAAVPFITEDQARMAFGKANPYKYGVLPVLVILQNNTGKALRLNLNAEFEEAQGQHLEATPASDVTFIGGNVKPPKVPGSGPLPFPTRKKKGPLNTWEIEGRAFTAKLLPDGDSVYGFFYFQTAQRPGSKLYLTGIKDAASGQDYFYFEVPVVEAQ